MQRDSEPQEETQHGALLQQTRKRKPGTSPEENQENNKKNPGKPKEEDETLDVAREKKFNSAS